jgi:hypothetical protein
MIAKGVPPIVVNVTDPAAGVVVVTPPQRNGSQNWPYRSISRTWSEAGNTIKPHCKQISPVSAPAHLGQFFMPHDSTPVKRQQRES